MENLTQLGKTITIKRHESGYSSGKAAKLLNVSPAYYSRLENGKERPSPELLKDIVEKYKLHLEDKVLLDQLAGYATIGDVQKGENTDRTEAIIKLDANKVPVLYSDSMFITVSEDGIVFDFAQKVANTREQNITTRVGMSYKQARKVQKLLDRQLNLAKKMNLEN